MTKIQNKITPHGFLEPTIDTTHYTLGALERLKGLPDIVLRPDGQYDTFLPVKEYQQKGNVETYACTSFGTLNALEIFNLALGQAEINLSERYSAITANTNPDYGNDPHTVAEAIRSVGSVSEADLPFDGTIDTRNKFYSPKPMTEKYIAIGRNWLNDYDFGHEWLWTNKGTALKTKQARMVDMLKYSPLGVSVLAWKYRNGYYWKNTGEQDIHWCCCYGYVYGKYWKIYDSYDDTTKELEWNYDFNWSKRYYLKKKDKYMLQRKKGTDEVYLTLGGKLYWIKDQEDFNLLKQSQPIKDLEWKNVVEVSELGEYYDGRIIGKPDFKISELLTMIFAKMAGKLMGIK